MWQPKQLFRRLLYGPVNYPQQMMLGLQAPQQEVDVWLHGLGEPLLITRNHAIACCAPLTFCIGLPPRDAEKTPGKAFVLVFSRHASKRVLGKIWVRCTSSIAVGSETLCLFQVVRSRNYTLSRLRMWAHHRQYERSFKPEKNPDVPISTTDARALTICFLCPRLIYIVTVVDGDGGNIFPMNLAGPVGNGLFAFALNRHRCAAPLVDKIRQATLSNVPPEKAGIVSSLGANHRKTSIRWDELPFALAGNNALTGPIPSFAMEALEFRVEDAFPLGSHMLFIAKESASVRIEEGEQLFNAHGLYQALRDL